MPKDKRTVNRREFLQTSALAAVAASHALVGPGPAVLTTRNERRPNILLLFADQFRADALGAAGNALIRTPVLDDLCAAGTRFDRTYTPSPVCVPARFSVLTGLYPHRSGCANNGEPMSPELPTFPAVLTEAGYQTIGIGKMHFHPVRARFGLEKTVLSEEIPRSPEEDEFLRDLIAAGFGHVHEPHGIRSELYYIPQVSQLPAHLHTTAWTADQTIRFLRERDKSRPFFVWTSFIKPHPPFDPPVPWNKLYRDWEMPLPHRPERWRELVTWHMRFQNHYKRRDDGTDNNLLRAMKAAYYACISFIDYHAGRILEELDRQGLLENTLIVFAADHGELLGDYYSFGKRCFLDPSARVPLIVRWPVDFPAGKVCSMPASLVDLFPTFLQVAGVDWERFRPDGFPLQQVVAGRADRAYVVGQLSRRSTGVYFLYDGRHKYIYSSPDRREYLLDLEQDPGETRNFALDASLAGLVAGLREQLIDHFRQDGYLEPLGPGSSWTEYPSAPAVEPPPSNFRQDARWTDPYVKDERYRRVDSQ